MPAGDPLSASNVRAALIVLVVLGGLVLLYVLRDILTPFAVAFALAYFLNPAANALESVFARATKPLGRVGRWIHPRALAVGLLAGLAFVVFVAIVAFVVPAVYHQVSEAVSKLPQYLASLRTKLEPTIHRLNLRYPEESEEIRTRIQEAVRTHILDVVSPLTRVLKATFSSALSVVLALIDLLIIPVFGIYLLHDMNRIKEGARTLVPPRYLAYVSAQVGDVDRVLSAFARGLVTVCLIMGTFYAIGFTIVGVPMGLLVGLLVGFFNVVPFMSYALGMPLALLLSWIDDQSPTSLLAVLAICTIGQFAEAHWITPRIVGEKMGVHAVIVLLAVLVGGSLFGIVGMILALPVTAALSVFWDDLKAAYLGSGFFTGARH
jgi:predicted PurR-regulated permease PerM